MGGHGGGGGGGYSSDEGSQGYASGNEWDPTYVPSDEEDDPGFAGQGPPPDSWSGAPTALTYELLDGEVRKKKHGNSWQYGRIFKQWVPAPAIEGFKCSGTTINVWVQDSP